MTDGLREWFGGAWCEPVLFVFCRMSHPVRTMNEMQKRVRGRLTHTTE